MRLAGTLNAEADAKRLADYLLAAGVGTRILPEGSAWGLWVRDENQIDRAKQELAAFLANRDDPRYAAAAATATTIRKTQVAADAQAKKRWIDVRQRWQQPGRVAVVVNALLLISIAVTMYSELAEKEAAAALRARIFIAEPPPPGSPPGTLPSLDAVKRGEVWRLLTPIFLHFDALHLIFNMLWLYRLGTAIERTQGSVWLALFVLAIGIAANLGQFYFPGLGDTLIRGDAAARVGRSFTFGGMSGVVYGLFGYLWIRSRRDRTSPYFIDDRTVLLMLLWFSVCVLGLIGNVANTAHAVGLLGGMATGEAYAVMRRRGMRR